MDTQDQRTDSTSPEIMLPDGGARPPLPETAEVIDATGATAVATLPEPPIEQKKSPTPLQDSLRRLRRDKRAMASLGLVLFFVVLAIVGPPIYQHIGGVFNSPDGGPLQPSVYHGYAWEELSQTDVNPFTSAQYPLGTDTLGQDLLARLMQGL